MSSKVQGNLPIKKKKNARREQKGKKHLKSYSAHERGGRRENVGNNPDISREKSAGQRTGKGETPSDWKGGPFNKGFGEKRGALTRGWLDDKTEETVQAFFMGWFAKTSKKKKGGLQQRQ